MRASQSSSTSMSGTTTTETSTSSLSMSGSYSLSANNCAISCNIGSGDRVCTGTNASGAKLAPFKLKNYKTGGKRYSACFKNVTVGSKCFDAGSTGWSSRVRGGVGGMSISIDC